MNPANLTAAERDTILAALYAWRERACLTESDRKKAREIATAHGPAMDFQAIDRLCERLSAPVAPSGFKRKERDRIDFIQRRIEHLKKRIASDSRDLSFDKQELGALSWALERIAQPPQAPEPVNAELLMALSEILDADSRNEIHRDPLDTDAIFEHAHIAKARAESALAAQKGGK